MYRIVIASLVFMVVIFFGMGLPVTAQTNCPNIEGVWDFDQTFIELCYSTAPGVYAPGIVKGETLDNTSGTPTYVRKMGTQEFFQDPNHNCLFWAKRIMTNQGRYSTPPDPQVIPPPLQPPWLPERIDWYVGMIDNGGSKLTMRIIPNAGTPAARAEGKITSFDRRNRPKEIEYIVDTDVPSPFCGGPGLTGADKGAGSFYNRR
jgi:hypothetical protein